MAKDQASAGLPVALPKQENRGVNPSFQQLWNSRTSGGLAAALSMLEDTYDGAFGQHCIWRDIEVVDATAEPGRQFNPLYMIQLGIVQPDRMEHVRHMVTAYVAAEAKRVAANMNATGTCELFFAQNEQVPNELYCFIRVHAYIH